MANILDVAPVIRTVKTHRYGDLEITGLSIEGLVVLLKAHPQIVEIFKGGKVDVDFQKLLDLGLAVTSSFLAAGQGQPGNPDVIDKCRKMNTEDAWKVGQAIIEESFPGGAQSFFDQVSATIGGKSLVSLKRVQDQTPADQTKAA